MKRKIVPFLLMLILLGADQLTKYLAASLLPGRTVSVISGMLELVYVENTGAAFSSFTGRTLPLLLVSAVLILCLGWIYWRIPNEKKWNRLRVGLSIILAGAIGNAIDRARLGHVVDFIYFKPINFPKFNLADCYITIAIVLLLLLVLFVYKDKDMKEIKILPR